MGKTVFSSLITSIEAESYYFAIFAAFFQINRFERYKNYCVMRILFFRTFLACLLLASPTELLSRSLTPDEAQRTAEAFYESCFRTPRAGHASPEFRLVRPRSSRGLLPEAVYAFNVGREEGFVLVSADDRMRPVAGYALSGSFSYEDMPVQLRSLLDDYARQYEALTASGVEITVKDSPYATVKEEPTGKSVAPLLGAICWSQDEPFNRLCPMDKYYEKMRTPAGCVATAAAQIMKYHGYPQQGIGNRSYTTETERLPVSADFSAATYDWKNMLADYNGSYSEAQAQAVAQLVFHVGVACRMDYNYEGSGATAKEAAKAFTRYFGYDENIEYIDRTHYDEPSWEALMRAELDAGRPILQFGEGEGGGHAFVCDGYDGRGFFHYNWGWGGMSDGYFRSSVLEPEYLGIGSGLGAYNHLQAMLTNIQPPNPSSAHLAGLQLAKPLAPATAFTARDAETSVSASFYNYGLRNFTGESALLLCDTDGKTVSVLSVKQLNNIRELEGGTKGTDYRFSIPAEVPEGTYRIYLAHKENGAAEYTKMRTPVNVADYLLATVGATSVSYAQPDHAARLSLTVKPEVIGSLYSTRRASFRITVRNDGEEFYSYLGVLMQKQSSGTEKVRQYVGVILTRIPKGETRTFVYSTDSIEVSFGKYDIVAVCDHSNSGSTYFDAIGPDELMVTEATVKPRPLLSPNFVLSAPLRIETPDGSGNVVANQMFSVRASLLNKGGYGDGSFALVFFNRDEEMIGNSNIVPLTLDRQESGDLVITHKLNVPPGQYGVILTSVKGLEAQAIGPDMNNGQVFNVSAPTSVTDIKVTGETDAGEQWYDLSGRPVRSPASGIYISRSGRKIIVK